jgi:hypothetical protein
LDQAKNYWSAAKCRLQAWQRTLRQLAGDTTRPPDEYNNWPATRSVVEEIFLSEVATRLWTAILTQADLSGAQSELTGLANGIFVAQLEVSNKAMRLLLQMPESHRDAVDRVNQLRLRLERWTDLLLGCLPESRIAARYGFDRRRISEFALDHSQQPLKSRAQSCRLLAASLAADLRNLCGKYPANPDLNRPIATGILEFFGPQRFDSHGIPKSPFLVQIERGQQDLEALCDELAVLEAPPPAVSRGNVPAPPPRLPRPHQ